MNQTRIDAFCNALAASPSTNYTVALMTATPDNTFYIWADESGAMWRLFYTHHTSHSDRAAQTFTLEVTDPPIQIQVSIQFRNRAEADKIVGANLQRLLIHGIRKVFGYQARGMPNDKVQLNRGDPEVEALYRGVYNDDTLGDVATASLTQPR